MAVLDSHADKWTPEPNTGCYLWTGAVRNKSTGRPAVYAGQRKMAMMARLVCEEAHGPPPTPKHHAAHNRLGGCVGAPCIAPNHLRWASPRENQMDVPVEIRRKRVAHEVVNRGARYAAKQAGEKFYSTGNPCPRGHIGLRYVRNGECKECSLSWRKYR
jgi:hypothetical protein